MSSPQSSDPRDGTTAEARKFEQVTFRFCSECSNMLYPKEDEDARQLQFTCRTCQYTEPAQSSCVWRNVLNSAAGETAGVTQDVGSDPTVSDPQAQRCGRDSSPVMCLLCGCAVICDVCDRPTGELLLGKPKTTRIASNDESIHDVHGQNDTVNTKGSSESATTGIIPLSSRADFSFWDNDPFAEYDEEPMEDAPALTHDSSSPATITDSELDTDGAMLPRSNKHCPKCAHEEAVFFQSQERSAETGMKLFYVCCECGHIFT